MIAWCRSEGLTPSKSRNINTQSKWKFIKANNERHPIRFGPIRNKQNTNILVYGNYIKMQASTPTLHTANIPSKLIDLDWLLGQVCRMGQSAAFRVRRKRRTRNAAGAERAVCGASAAHGTLSETVLKALAKVPSPWYGVNRLQRRLRSILDLLKIDAFVFFLFMFGRQSYRFLDVLGSNIGFARSKKCRILFPLWWNRLE